MSDSNFSRSEIKEISRQIAREEFTMMHAEMRETMRQVIDEKLGETYNEEREFIHRWIKKTDQFSNGVWGKLGSGMLFMTLAGLGALALVKMGIITAVAK